MSDQLASDRTRLLAEIKSLSRRRIGGYLVSAHSLIEIACARLDMFPDYGERLLFTPQRKHPHSIEARAKISAGTKQAWIKRRAA